MLRFPPFLAVGVALLLRTAASPAPDITIYRPLPDLPGATQIASGSVIGVSALGVDNGLTKYIVNAVESFVAVANSVSTQTLLTTPQTVTFTIEENDSIYNALATQTVTINGEVVVENAILQCTANPSGGDASCIEIDSISGTGLPAGGVATTTRYLVATTPIFTITDDAATPSAATPSAATPSAATPSAATPSAATPTATTSSGVVQQITIGSSGGSSSTRFPVPTASSGATQLHAGGMYLSGFILFAVLFFVQ